MTEVFNIPLVAGIAPAIAAHVQDMTDLPVALQQLGLTQTLPTLALVGGASQMTDQDFDRLQQFFTQVIAQTVEQVGAAIVDGGTNTGIMQLMGQARQHLQANFPLIGVAPLMKLSLPHRSHRPPAATDPAPHHTHFVLVPGQQWGDESAWLAQVTTLLAGDRPSVTIVVNGGTVTWQDVVESVAAQRLTLVLAGSGRTADLIALALQGQVEDPEVNRLVASGYIELIQFKSDFSQLAQNLQRILIGSD